MALWQIPERIRLAFDQFNSKLKQSVSTCSRRGFCGVASEDFFKFLVNESKIKSEITVWNQTKTADNVEIPMLKIKNGFSQFKDLYIKRVCFCDTPCATNEASQLTRNKAIADCKHKISSGDQRKASCGHWAIMLSDHSTTEIKQTDYILDFTYKQMLVPSKPNHSSYRPENTFLNGEKQVTVGSLPEYYLSPISGTSVSRTPKWRNDYVCPEKQIYPITFKGGRRKKRRTYKK